MNPRVSVRLRRVALMVGMVFILLAHGCTNGPKWYRCTDQQCSNDAPHTTDYCITEVSIRSPAQFASQISGGCQSAAQRQGPTFLCRLGTVACTAQCQETNRHDACPIFVP